MNFYICAAEPALRALVKADYFTIHVYGSWVGLQLWYFDNSLFPIHLLFVSD